MAPMHVPGVASEFGPHHTPHNEHRQVHQALPAPGHDEGRAGDSGRLAILETKHDGSSRRLLAGAAPLERDKRSDRRERPQQPEPDEVARSR